MSTKIYDYEKEEPPFDDICINYGEVDAETTCNICMAEFLEIDDLQRHMDQVHASDLKEKLGKSCALCSTSYNDDMSYALHIRDKHIRSLLACHHCTKVFTDGKQCMLHEKKHIVRSGAYKCSQCPHKASNTGDLIDHENQHHNNSKDGLMLKDYMPYLSVALKVNSIKFLQSLGTDTSYVCVGCMFTTPNIDVFIEHAQKEDCSVYVCSHCSNTYSGKRLISRHTCQKSDDAINIKKSLKQCLDCNTSVKRVVYAKHKKTCNIIKCHRCNLVFDNMYELSEHQSKEHPLAVELTSCPICKKSFVGMTNLQNHMDRTHKGRLHMYKYLCVYCKSVFKHPQRLFGHFFANHKDINPYTCKICDKTFRARKTFTIHIKLEHKSVGFVEFDENYHVFFSEKKSENPFIPTSVYEEVEDEVSVEKSDNNIELVDGTDCNYTESDGNATDTEPPQVRQRVKRAIKVEKKSINCSESSDDEPLAVKKRALKKRTRGKKVKASNKFVCNICDKYCYTYQNYTHHMSLHSKKDIKKCIKCSKVFRSKEKLSRHIIKHHSSSKLTEALKSLLEKRKSGVTTASDISMAERFRRTIKKVEIDPSSAEITITPVENGISVQKFIESFTPEDHVKNESNTSVSVTLIKGLYRKPVIKMTKFVQKPVTYSTKLAMPVKFKDRPTEAATVSVKIVQEPAKTYCNAYEDDVQEHYETDHDYVEKNNSIPEVAEEVLLDGGEETPRPMMKQHRVIIPKAVNKLSEMRIAHLLPEAPFYKIVKVAEVLPSDVMKQMNKRDDDVDSSQTPEALELPDGTKLVTTNPLAHLLGDIPVEKVLDPMRKKYYKSKQKNLKGMLAKALSMLDHPAPPKKKKKD